MALTPFLRWDTDVYYTEEDEPHVIGKCYEDHGGLCTYDQMNAFDNTCFDLSAEERHVNKTNFGPDLSTCASYFQPVYEPGATNFENEFNVVKFVHD